MRRPALQWNSSWDDMIHGWHGYAHALDEAQEAIDRIGQFVNEKMPR